MRWRRTASSSNRSRASTRAFGVPTTAIVLQGVLASALALLNAFDSRYGYAALLNYAVFADWIFFALAGVALIAFRRKLPDAPRPQPTPLYPLTPILFTLAGAGIVLNTYIAQPQTALIGTVILLLGVPIYFLFVQRR